MGTLAAIASQIGSFLGGLVKTLILPFAAYWAGKKSAESKQQKETIKEAGDAVSARNRARIDADERRRLSDKYGKPADRKGTE